MVAELSDDETRESPNEGGNLMTGNALDVLDPDVAALGDDYLDAEVGFATLLDDKVRHASLVHQPTTLTRSFDSRISPRTGMQRTANLILSTLKSYPMMVQRHDSLPPFIHSSFTIPEEGNSNLEPLTNCLNLVHMLRSPYHGKRKLFWKNVRLECERWCAEHLEMNRPQLITAMQALLIYILIRLGEGEMEHNNLDALLVRSVVLTATQFNIINMTQSESSLYSHDLSLSWKEWLFEESARRLCVVYQILGMLIHFEPAAMCDESLVLGPLPARKQLWEASDEFTWKAESEREPGLETTYGLAANGDLVMVDESQRYKGNAVLHQRSYDYRTSTWAAAKWEEWYSGMDGFGGLVMLAASLKAQ